MEYPRIRLTDLIYLAFLFNNDKTVKTYVRLVNNKKIEFPSYVKCTTEDKNREWEQDKILIQVRIDLADPYFNKLNNIFENSKYYDGKSMIYIDSIVHYIYRFDCPFKYTRDYELVKEGFYSKIDYDTKVMIIGTWNLPTNGRYFNVLFNSNNAKKLDGTPMIRNEAGEYLNKIDDPVPLESFTRSTVITEEPE